MSKSEFFLKIQWGDNRQVCNIVTFQSHYLVAMGNNLKNPRKINRNDQTVPFPQLDRRIFVCNL